MGIRNYKKSCNYCLHIRQLNEKMYSVECNVIVILKYFILYETKKSKQHKIRKTSSSPKLIESCIFEKARADFCPYWIQIDFNTAVAVTV